MKIRTNGHDLGLHRVIEPAGVLPQAAQKINNEGPAFDNEITIAVQTLNVDSASFHQIVGEVGRHADKVTGRVKSIIEERGKMQNPVTGSGGMLLGKVTARGENYTGPVEVGDDIATLVSLTLTPLSISEFHDVHFDADQIDVTGTAFLASSAPVVKLPSDLDAKVALSALDVCGAPAQAERLCKGAGRVLILGAGKSGMLCAAAARRVMGPYGTIYGFDLFEDNVKRLQDLKLIDAFRTGDATDAVSVMDAVLDMSGGELVDVVINTCNVANTEMSAVLSCRERGKVYFFNMATSFAKAALGSEGVGRDVDLLIGNGYANGHAELTLDLVRENAGIRNYFASLLKS